MEEKEQIEQQKDEQYLSEIRYRYELRQNTARRLRKRQRALENSSYLFNIISAATASFFVFSITGNYPLIWQLVFGVLLVGLIVAGELAKRYTISEGSEGMPGWYVPAVVLIGVSFFVSYEGGNRFTVEMATPPPVVHNARIDTLQKQIAAIDDRDAKMQSAWDQWTKTKKVWPSDAFTYFKDGGREKADEMKSLLLAQLTKLENRDIKNNDNTTEKHEAETMKFGYIFGGTAGAMDLLLFACLFLAKRDEKEARYLAGVKEEESLDAHAHTPTRTRTHAHTRADARTRTLVPARTRTRVDAHARTHARKDNDKKKVSRGNRVCQMCKEGYHLNKKGSSKKFCSDDCRQQHTARKKSAKSVA